MNLIKIDHIVSGEIDNPDNPPGIESDYINLNNVASITPIIYQDDSGKMDYTINIAYTSGDNARLDVPPWVYDSVMAWLDSAVVFSGDML